jgi:CheY-like chemotaxis protein
MPDILLVTGRRDLLTPFADSLAAAEEVRLVVTQSAVDALEKARSPQLPQLAIVDSSLPDMTSLELVKELLQVNAMINTVVVSPLSDEEFHEASEGLGVMARLPDPPGPEDGLGVLEQLERILHPG